MEQSTSNHESVQGNPIVNLSVPIRYAIAPLLLVTACAAPAKQVATVEVGHSSPTAQSSALIETKGSIPDDKLLKLKPAPKISFAEGQFGYYILWCKAKKNCDDNDTSCIAQCTDSAYEDMMIRCDSGSTDSPDSKKFCDEKITPNHSVKHKDADDYIGLLTQICQARHGYTILHKVEACAGEVRERLKSRCEINPDGLQDYCNK